MLLGMQSIVQENWNGDVTRAWWIFINAFSQVKTYTSVMARMVTVHVKMDELNTENNCIQWMKTVSCFVQYLLLSFFFQLLALFKCTFHHHILFFLVLWLRTVIKLETFFPDILTQRAFYGRLFTGVCQQTAVSYKKIILWNLYYYFL